MPDDVVMPFPEGFLWGTATSAHQVEGGNQNNDWWDWEQVAGHIRDGSTSRLACDHYHRYIQDWSLAQEMGQNAHRLGLEWSRIEPAEGEWNAAAVAHYRDVLKEMRLRGLEPLVTLHHFTNPRWFAAKGAWENRESVRLFTRYVGRVVGELDDLCSRWVTINEPMVYFYEGYLTRRWPPGKGGLLRGLAGARNMVRAHGRAYQFIHSIQPQAEVGIAHNMRLFDPLRAQSRLDRAAAGSEDRVFNRVLLWALTDGYVRAPLGRGEHVPEAAGSLDFIGLNYYARDMVSFALRRATAVIARNTSRAGAETDGFGWEMYPEGLRRLSGELSSFGKPIYITEHGLADATDAQRPAYLVRSLAALWQAITEGAPVRGYYHWTLLDNFEWAEGYAVPFGLVSVEQATQERRIKTSGLVYRDICRANGITRSLLQTYAPELLH